MKLINLFPLAIGLLFSCNENQENKNVEKVKLIKRGMKVEDVKRIMGNPDAAFVWPIEPNSFRYLYKSPTGMSDNIYIIISKKDSIVISVNDGT